MDCSVIAAYECIHNIQHVHVSSAAESRGEAVSDVEEVLAQRLVSSEAFIQRERGA